MAKPAERLALGFVELVPQRLVLGRQSGDPLLQLGDDRAEGLVLLTVLFNQCTEPLPTRVRPRS